MKGPEHAYATFMTRCGCERRTVMPTPLPPQWVVPLRRETTFGDLINFSKPVKVVNRVFRLRRSWISDSGTMFADYTEE